LQTRHAKPQAVAHRVAEFGGGIKVASVGRENCFRIFHEYVGGPK
jgi:hypothetical protein